jgi:hypothetical protein
MDLDTDFEYIIYLSSEKMLFGIYNNLPEFTSTTYQTRFVDALTNIRDYYRPIYNAIHPEFKMLPLSYALVLFASPIVVQYIKDQWYEETLLINDPGPFAQSHLYRDGKLHVREGIEEILEYLTLRVKYADEFHVLNKTVQEKLYGVIEEYKTIFGISGDRHAE